VTFVRWVREQAKPQRQTDDDLAMPDAGWSHPDLTVDELVLPPVLGKAPQILIGDGRRLGGHVPVYASHRRLEAATACTGVV
jgi:hypothetical protein